MRQLPIQMVTLSMLVVLLAAVAPVAIVHSADSASSTEVRASVESFVKQLDAPVLVDRTRAERGLLDLGPEGLKYFPAPELTPSASVRESLKRIRVQLERRAARESANASLVRYSGRATVAEVLSEIARQTRNRVELSAAVRSLASTAVSVEWDNQPFWACLDEICNVLKTRPVFDPQLGVLVLRPREATDRKELGVQLAGPYRLAILAAEVRPIVGNGANRLLRISGKLSLEPRLRPLFLHFAAADLAATAGDLRLGPWNPAATYELPAGDAGREVPVQFDFLMPIATTPREVTLGGRISVQLAAATERIVFDQTSQTAGAARRRGGVTVRLREVKFEGPPDGKVQAEIKVNVAYDTGGPAFESHRTWMFHNAVYFEDQAGRRVDFTDYDTTLQSNGAVGVDYRWEQLTGPVTQYHFVYEAPTLIVDLPLEIKLEKLPIKLLAPQSSPPGKE